MSENPTEKISRETVLRLSVDIVAAYVSKNQLPSAQIPGVIQAVVGSLSGLEAAIAEAEGEPPKPMISIRRSVTPDYIVCLEDGKRLKMLKRHLRTTYGMTPEDYRTKWRLPPDYPMVAPNYSKQRSEFAKKIGLGRKPTKPTKLVRRGKRGGRRKRA